MSKSIISEGKTTNEAIEKGLKELNISRNRVDIKVLESEEKRSFFSILTPRVVKVQLTLKEDKEHIEYNKKVRTEVELSLEEQEQVRNNIDRFLKEFLEKIQNDCKYYINISKTELKINIQNKNLGFLIGYRGETLYALQNILSAVVNKGLDKKIRVILDIEGYKDKRKRTLESFAEEIANTVIRTKKSITLEPMQAYERKIIHTKLQDSELVETRSIGEEPRRKIVISLKK